MKMPPEYRPPAPNVPTVPSAQRPRPPAALPEGWEEVPEIGAVAQMLEALPAGANLPRALSGWAVYLLLRLHTHVDRLHPSQPIAQASEETVAPPDPDEAIPEPPARFRPFVPSLRRVWATPVQIELTEHAFLAWYESRLTSHQSRLDTVRELCLAFGVTPSEASILITSGAALLSKTTLGDVYEARAHVLLQLQELVRDPMTSPTTRLSAIKTQAQLAGLMEKNANPDLAETIIADLEELAASDDARRAKIVIDVPAPYEQAPAPALQAPSLDELLKRQ